ncbi:MAG TPA: hypothetical protein VEY09_05440 [Pyrinomonadaceae bacterium]|nr:hypothetical protein [Pyrinomonadaceae bacterium]
MRPLPRFTLAAVLPAPFLLPVVLLSAVLLSAPLSSPASEGQRAKQSPPRAAAQPAQFVIYSVKKYEQVTQIEPVVIVRRGAFVKPPVEEDVTGAPAEAEAKRFIGRYLRPGLRLRLIFGGGDAGTLSVLKYVEPGCVGMYAEASAETSVRLGGQVQALATDSETLPRREPARRAPTEAERSAALEQARASFASAGVGPAPLKKTEVMNLTAVDLDRDGRHELIGSFRVDRSGGRSTDFNTLFVIFEPAGAGFKPALTWSHRGGEGEYGDRRLVDYLDLDGDGTAEVVAEGTYYESNNYVIYRSQQGRWRSVYQGGGGGC